MLQLIINKNPPNISGFSWCSLKKDYISCHIVNGFFFAIPILFDDRLFLHLMINPIIMEILVRIKSIRQLSTKRISLIILVILVIQSSSFCQDLPIGYINYFSHNCHNETLFNFLLPEHKEAWMIIKEEGLNVLRIKSSEDSLVNSFPKSRGVLNNLILGDYILEFEIKTDLMPNKDTAGFCFLGPVKSKEIYYSLLFSKDTLSFISLRSDSIYTSIKKSIPPLKSSWNKIRIERDILSRTIYIMLNNDKQNIVSFSDRNLVMGFIGFGSHSTTSYLRNIRLWAPTAIEDNEFQW